MSSGHDRAKKVIGIVLFVIYMIVMVHILFFSESRTPGGELRYNAILFHEIKRYLTNVDRIGWQLVFLNVFGNVLIFIPFGALVTFFFREKSCIVAKVTLISCLLSCAIEITQLFTRVGSCDVDDVILNTIGGFIGALVYYIHHRRRRKA